jgi:hypothetical protein
MQQGADFVDAASDRYVNEIQKNKANRDFNEALVPREGETESDVMKRIKDEGVELSIGTIQGVAEYNKAILKLTQDRLVKHGKSVVDIVREQYNFKTLSPEHPFDPLELERLIELNLSEWQSGMGDWVGSEAAQARVRNYASDNKLQAAYTAESRRQSQMVTVQRIALNDTLGQIQDEISTRVGEFDGNVELIMQTTAEDTERVLSDVENIPIVGEGGDTAVTSELGKRIGKMYRGFVKTDDTMAYTRLKSLEAIRDVLMMNIPAEDKEKLVREINDKNADVAVKFIMQALDKPGLTEEERANGAVALMNELFTGQIYDQNKIADPFARIRSWQQGRQRRDMELFYQLLNSFENGATDVRVENEDQAAALGKPFGTVVPIMEGMQFFMQKGEIWREQGLEGKLTDPQYRTGLENYITRKQAVRNDILSGNIERLRDQLPQLKSEGTIASDLNDEWQSFLGDVEKYLERDQTGEATDAETEKFFGMLGVGAQAFSMPHARRTAILNATNARGVVDINKASDNMAAEWVGKYSGRVVAANALNRDESPLPPQQIKAAIHDVDKLLSSNDPRKRTEGMVTLLSVAKAADQLGTKNPLDSPKMRMAIALAKPGNVDAAVAAYDLVQESERSEMIGPVTTDTGRTLEVPTQKDFSEVFGYMTGTRWDEGAAVSGPMSLKNFNALRGAGLGDKAVGILLSLIGDGGEEVVAQMAHGVALKIHRDGKVASPEDIRDGLVGVVQGLDSSPVPSLSSPYVVFDGASAPTLTFPPGSTVEWGTGVVYNPTFLNSAVQMPYGYKNIDLPNNIDPHYDWNGDVVFIVDGQPLLYKDTGNPVKVSPKHLNGLSMDEINDSVMRGETTYEAALSGGGDHRPQRSQYQTVSEYNALTGRAAPVVSTQVIDSVEGKDVAGTLAGQVGLFEPQKSVVIPGKIKIMGE